MGEEIILVAGRYQQQVLIGHGGMGDVYRGTDTHTGEPVAIKRLHQDIVRENPDIVDRFRREVEAHRPCPLVAPGKTPGRVQARPRVQRGIRASRTGAL